MPKKPKEKETPAPLPPTPEHEQENEDVDEKPIVITSADIKDGFCNYSYEIVKGVGIGDSHSVKGKGIYKPEMQEAFNDFRVHLAVIDGAFKLSAIDIEDINTQHNHDLVHDYIVTGFAMFGTRESESIVIKGNKYVSDAGGRIELKTPKIALDNLSSYKWYNELQTAANDARRQVELYRGGFCDPVEEPEEEKPKYTQMQIAPADNDSTEATDNDFQNAKV